MSKKWMYLLVISLIWGSSFILMKKALRGFDAVQVGALRILVAALILFIIDFKKIKLIQKRHWPYVVLTGLFGTFFPVFLFTTAIEHIDSAVTAVLNSTTPLITILLGAVFFGIPLVFRKLGGVLVGLIGAILLITYGAELQKDQDYSYAILVLIASIGYATSLNLVKSKLQDLDAYAITLGNFCVISFPAVLVLIYSFWRAPVKNLDMVGSSLIYVTLLAFLGTAVAKVMFNKLVQIATPLFSSSVTYLITTVAVFWGLLDGEKLYLEQILAMALIFAGLYLINFKKTEIKKDL